MKIYNGGNMQANRFIRCDWLQVFLARVVDSNVDTEGPQGPIFTNSTFFVLDGTV